MDAFQSRIGHEINTGLNPYLDGERKSKNQDGVVRAITTR